MTSTSQALPNTPDKEEVILNLLYLCALVLQPARIWCGLPIRVNSGYRSLAVNTAIGGAKNSQHMVGEAADITLGTPKLNAQLFNYIRDHLPFDQLIDEKNYRWIHVSIKRTGKNRKQVLHLA